MFERRYHSWCWGHPAAHQGHWKVQVILQKRTGNLGPISETPVTENFCQSCSIFMVFIHLQFWALKRNQPTEKAGFQSFRVSTGVKTKLQTRSLDKNFLQASDATEVSLIHLEQAIFALPRMFEGSFSIVAVMQRLFGFLLKRSWRNRQLNHFKFA